MSVNISVCGGDRWPTSAVASIPLGPSLSTHPTCHWTWLPLLLPSSQFSIALSPLLCPPRHCHGPAQTTTLPSCRQPNGPLSSGLALSRTPPALSPLPVALSTTALVPLTTTWPLALCQHCPGPPPTVPWPLITTALALSPLPCPLTTPGPLNHSLPSHCPLWPSHCHCKPLAAPLPWPSQPLPLPMRPPPSHCCSLFRQQLNCGKIVMPTGPKIAGIARGNNHCNNP